MHYPGEKTNGDDAWTPPEGHWGATAGAAVARMAPATAGLLAYLLLPFGGGVPVYLLHRDVEVRFHAAQSALLTGALVAFAAAAGVLGAGFWLLGIGAVHERIVQVVALVALVGWVVLCVLGQRRQHVKIPIVGDLAERLALRPPA